ncbi:Teichoic acid biosynthesis protein [Gracilibacillus halophilus YIM-C55.5]|uniref:Teichoic acid biosynthesis protein n=1 Tax=Gracilibacillus halophilus YIM-C55.5 TaxID=1308866 RepID=N4WYJ7_9BACI|nr:WecB/TagA/CpsF family glycosyltransferase [Gracilibacillus halophilus]ENH98106.1 Teichoic acid biosynthesis protein [Gracilibacillus halophilus YIM-C55.5]
MKKVSLFNINFDNYDFNDLSKFIDNSISRGDNRFIVTCNVDHIIKLRKSKSFSEVYRAADVVVADGAPIVWSSKILGKPLKSKLSGSDILPILGSSFENKKYKIFLLGAKEGVAKKASENLKKTFPNINIVGYYSPPIGFEESSYENEKIKKMLKRAKPDILFVALGAPKQELWIYNNYQDYNIPISIGVGATLDFIAGNIKRAPVFMQKIGLEWFWRLLKEPKRMWKRYLVEDSKFIYIFIKELLKKK